MLAVLAATAAALAIWSTVGDGDDASFDGRPTVVFIVLDAVRSDRLSLCGYSRPTSPGLERLAELGAAFTCDAYSPSTWTLPSHASYFTGTELTEHRADNLLAGSKVDGSIALWDSRKVPLSARFETLAESFQRAGYQTASVSGNPLLSRWASAGLDQGFEIVRASHVFGGLYRGRLVEAVDRVLRRNQTARVPLFLFVNIADAHMPWAAVPAGLAWIPSGPGFHHYNWDDQESPFARMLSGTLDAAERRRFVEQMGNAYDFAVSRADRSLQGVIDTLGRRGYLSRPFRMIVTSDHGEFLGEHDLVGHFTFTYEECTRVPLLYWQGGPTEALPGPTTALHAYDLALDGRLPDPLRPVRSAGNPTPQLAELFGEHLRVATAATWSATGKQMWIGGELFDVRLSSGEPEQLVRAGDAGVEIDPSFGEFIAAMELVGEDSEPSSPEMEQALKALGYLR